MKVFIFIVICIAAVYGASIPSDEIDEKMKGWRKECLTELKLDPRLLNDEENAATPSPQEEACFQACLDKKLGVMNEDGSFNLGPIEAMAVNPEDKKMVEKVFYEKIKNCQIEVGNDLCKMAACAHSMPNHLWARDQ